MPSAIALSFASPLARRRRQVAYREEERTDGKGEGRAALNAACNQRGLEHVNVQRYLLPSGRVDNSCAELQADESCPPHDEGALLSVLVIRIEAFDALMERLSGSALVALLADLWGRLDTLADAHSLQRVESGQLAQYVAVGGLKAGGWRDRCQPVDALRMALSCSSDDAARPILPDGSSVRLHVGLHVGAPEWEPAWRRPRGASAWLPLPRQLKKVVAYADRLATHRMTHGNESERLSPHVSLDLQREWAGCAKDKPASAPEGEWLRFTPQQPVKAGHLATHLEWCAAVDTRLVGCLVRCPCHEHREAIQVPVPGKKNKLQTITPATRVKARRAGECDVCGAGFKKGAVVLECERCCEALGKNWVACERCHLSTGAEAEAEGPAMGHGDRVADYVSKAYT